MRKFSMLSVLVLLGVACLGFALPRYRQVVCDRNSCRVVETVKLEPVQFEQPQAGSFRNGSLPTGVTQNVTPAGSFGVGDKSGNATGAPVGKASDSLPDDSGKGHLLIVGDKSLHARAKAVLEATPSAEKYHHHFYEGKEWQIQEGVWPAGITIAKAANKEGAAEMIHHQEDVEGLGDAINESVGLIRKPEKLIDKKLIPDLRKGVSSIIPWEDIATYGSGALLTALLGIAAIFTLKGT